MNWPQTSVFVSVTVCVYVSYSGLPFPSHWRWKLSPSLGRSLLGEICTFGESLSHKEREREKREGENEREREIHWLHNKRLSANTSTAAIISFSLISIYLLPSASSRRHRVGASQGDITPLNNGRQLHSHCRRGGGDNAASPTTGWQHWHRLLCLPPLFRLALLHPHWLTQTLGERARGLRVNSCVVVIMSASWLKMMLDDCRGMGGECRSVGWGVLCRMRWERRAQPTLKQINILLSTSALNTGVLSHEASDALSNC